MELLFNRYVKPAKLDAGDITLLKELRRELRLIKKHSSTGLPKIQHRAMSLGAINITEV